MGNKKGSIMTEYENMSTLGSGYGIKNLEYPQKVELIQLTKEFEMQKCKTFGAVHEKTRLLMRNNKD